MNLNEQVYRIQEMMGVLSEKTQNLSFKFNSEKVKNVEGVLSHEIITISPFTTVDDIGKIKPKPFHLIFGKDSLAIFDAFNTDEIAGLKREDCIKKIESLKKKNKTEKYEAFIAGLTNIKDGKLFLFINVERMKEKYMADRTIPHECLHMARLLLTFHDNPKINLKDENWWKKTKFTSLKDSNEETFSEMLERCVTIVFDRYNKL